MEKYIGCGLGIRELSDLAYYFGWAISGLSYDKKCLKLATVKNRLKWSDFGMVEYLVFFSMGFGRDPVFLKFVMQVLFLIQSRPEFIDQLFDSGDRRQCIMEVLIDNRFDSKYNL